MTVPPKDRDHDETSIHERLAIVETKIQMIDERGSKNFEALALMVAKGRGAIITMATIFGAVAGSIMAWILSWFHQAR